MNRSLLLLLSGLLVTSCGGPSTNDFDGDGTVDSVDCAPDDPSIHLGAPELCSDGVDNDCDSWIDCTDADCLVLEECDPSDDDDSIGDDDDTVSDDDDDDSAGDDDDSAGDDDDSAGDDDDSAGDDDDSAGDDDDSAGDDDDTGPLVCPGDHHVVDDPSNPNGVFDAIDDCTEIVGDLTIEGISLNSLNLPNLESIGGTLEIVDNPSLEDLRGLSVLMDVGGLVLDNNASLLNLDGLGQTTSLSALTIRHNNSLTDLTALAPLQTIGGDLIIEQNDQLFTCAQMGALTSVGGDVTIKQNNDLLNVACLSQLTNLNGSLIIWGNPALLNLTALSGSSGSALMSVGGTLHLEGLPSLSNVAALASLQSVGGLIISRIPLLSDLTGLHGITGPINGDLVISDNDSLSTIQGLSNLNNLVGNAEITGNPDLYDLMGLSLETVTGNLTIAGNDALADLTGLGALEVVSGDLTISNNNNLASLSGLGTLITVGGALSIDANWGLTSLNGLDDFTQAQTLSITDNPILGDLDNLIDNVPSLVYLIITANGSLCQIAVEELEGLCNCTYTSSGNFTNC